MKKTISFLKLLRSLLINTVSFTFTTIAILLVLTTAIVVTVGGVCVFVVKFIPGE